MPFLDCQTPHETHVLVRRKEKGRRLLCDGPGEVLSERQVLAGRGRTSWATYRCPSASCFRVSPLTGNPYAAPCLGGRAAQPARAVRNATRGAVMNRLLTRFGSRNRGLSLVTASETWRRGRAGRALDALGGQPQTHSGQSGQLPDPHWTSFCQLFDGPTLCGSDAGIGAGRRRSMSVRSRTRRAISDARSRVVSTWPTTDEKCPRAGNARRRTRRALTQNFA